jgi:hypothetical protein
VKIFRSISILFFAVVLFIGTVGIHIFEHFCQVDGADYSFYLPPSHACATETESASCCYEKPQRNTPIVEKNCCNEALTSYQLNADFTQHTSAQEIILLPANVLLVTNYLPTNEIIDDCPSFYKHLRRPPPKKGQEILILHQVFRI